jgi:hypothetical protein
MPAFNDDQLIIIDKALAGIDDALAAKYPGIATSRASLMHRREQLVASRAERDWLTVGPAVADAALTWRAVPETAVALVVTVRTLFAEATPTTAPGAAYWASAGAMIVQWPSSSGATATGLLAVELSG